MAESSIEVVLIRRHQGILELDPPGTSDEAECSRDLFQDDSSSMLGRRCTHIYRATSTIVVARPYTSRASERSSTPELIDEVYVARSREICISVVKVLLIAIYLEGKDTYMYIRPTLMSDSLTTRGHSAL